MGKFAIIKNNWQKATPEQKRKMFLGTAWNVTKLVGTVALGGVLAGPGGALGVLAGWTAYGGYKTYQQQVKAELNKIQKEQKAKGVIKINSERNANKAKKRAFLKVFGDLIPKDGSYYSAVYNDINKDESKMPPNKQQKLFNPNIINRGKDPR